MRLRIDTAMRLWIGKRERCNSRSDFMILLMIPITGNIISLDIASMHW